MARCSEKSHLLCLCLKKEPAQALKQHRDKSDRRGSGGVQSATEPAGQPSAAVVTSVDHKTCRNVIYFVSPFTLFLVSSMYYIYISYKVQKYSEEKYP